MSEPSYRINTEHRPSAQFPAIPWEGRVTRLSDGEQIAVTFGATEEEVIEKAQTAIRAATAAIEGGRVLFADETGEITEGATA